MPTKPGIIHLQQMNQHLLLAVLVDGELILRVFWKKQAMKQVKTMSSE